MIFKKENGDFIKGTIYNTNTEQTEAFYTEKYVLELRQEIERLNNLINTIFDFNFFKEECPLNFGFSDKNEEKSQDVFYEDDYCEKNCNDEYKKCWLKYFERLQKLKEKGDEQMKINASHFKTMEELIRHINMCVREEDIFALERYVGLNELNILVKEIARLKNAIDKIKSIMNEYDFSYNDEWYEEPTSQELRDDYYAQSYIDIHRVYLILQELKEEGK